MSEENTQPTPDPSAEATPEQEAPVQDAPVAEAAEPAAETAPAFDLDRALDEAPVDRLRRHPKFAGIVGSEKQRWQADWEAQRQQQIAAEQRAHLERELEDLAQNNPVAFADRWMGERAAERARAQVANLETNARQALGQQIGAAMHAIPEWGDVAADPEALAALAKALEGKADGEVLTAWNTAALDLVAHRRAEKLAEERLAKRLKEERAAWETEAAAQGFVRTERSDLVRGGQASSSDPEPPFGTPEWRAWYERTTPGAARLSGRR